MNGIVPNMKKSKITAGTRQWSGKWICASKLRPFLLYDKNFVPVPYFRNSFGLVKTSQNALVYFCAPGWHELYINGQKVDDRVRSPTMPQFDRHVSYICYDVSNATIYRTGGINVPKCEHLHYDPVTPDIQY